MRFAWAVLFLLFLSEMLSPQVGNSTKKVRVTPNQTSQEIGSAINWQPDFDAVYRCVVESQQCARTVGKEAGADVQTIEFWEEAGQVMLVLIQHTNNAAQAV